MVLRGLLKDGHTVAAVVAETDAFEARRAADNRRFARHGAYESLPDCARGIGVPVHQPPRFHDPVFQEVLDATAPDLFVCVSYHTIFRTSFLSKYPGRVINAHLAPLPHYRGRAPLNWAILRGETETAVTVHIVDEGVDTGPIIVQRPVPIGPDDYAIDVLLRALPEFAVAVQSSIERLADPSFRPHPQDPNEGSYFGRRTWEDGVIDWLHVTVVDAYNKIRALADPYPGAFSYANGAKIVIQRASPLMTKTMENDPGRVVAAPDDRSESVAVAATDRLLLIERVGEDEAQVPASVMLRPGMKLAAHP